MRQHEPSTRAQFALDLRTARNKILVSREIGDELRLLRLARDWPLMTVCDKYADLRYDYPALGALDEGSLSKIERGIRDKRGRSYIKRGELEALFWLLGAKIPDYFARGAAIVSPLEHAAQAADFQPVLLREAFLAFKEIISWGDGFLPCSYLTSEFMREQHRCVYSAERLSLPAPLAQRVIDTHNDIGEAMIQSFDRWSHVRVATIVHLLFRSDLQHLIDGTGVYAGIDDGVRDRCLDRVESVLNTKRYRAELWVCSDPAFRDRVRTVDAMACIDGRFAFWRSHSGLTEWTSDPQIVRAKHHILSALRCASSRVTGAMLRTLGQERSLRSADRVPLPA